MSKNDMITIGQILEMTPGDRQNATWINDEFEAVVSDIKRGTGKAPSTAVLTDPHNNGIAIVGNFFGTDPSRFAGKICHFSGKGMTRTEYKGVQQVTIGDKATIQVVGSASPGQAAASGSTGGSSGSAGSSSVIHGATVGMAINQASECIRSSCTYQDMTEARAYYTSPAFSKDLWTIASDIVRIARVMEAGKLADSPKHRADPYAKKREEEAAKAAAEKAEAERKAKEEQARKEANQAPTGNVDEEIPF